MTIFFFLLICKIGNNYISNNNISFLNNDGIFKIISLSNYLYFSIENNLLLLSDKQKYYFRIINIEYNFYYIESRNRKKRLGIDNNNNIISCNIQNNANNLKLIWQLIKVKENKYIINYFHLIPKKYSLKGVVFYQISF